MSFNLTKGVSIAAWVNLAEPAVDQKIAGNQDNSNGGYKLGIYNDKAEFEIRDSSNAPTTNRFIEGGTVLEPGTWYHIVGTYSQGGSVKTYVNSKLDRELQTANILTPAFGTFKIGREPFLDLFWFNGSMDDLQIYSYPLSETEVAALYEGKELPSTAPGVLAASGEKTGASSYIILVLIIVIIAAAAAGLAIRKKKTTA